MAEPTILARVTRRALATFGITSFAMCALEGTLLVCGFERAPRPDPFARAFAGGRIDGYVLHELDARQLWRPVPGATVPWGRDVLDANGFRGPELARAREPGVARIAALGDSAAFGRGVAADACWIAVASRALAERGTPCEALNAGVVGFTVRQGLERYRESVRPFAPDVVVLAFGASEEHEPALGLGDDAWIARGGALDAGRGPFARLASELRVVQAARWIASGMPPDTFAEERARAEQERAEGLDVAGEPDWPGERRVSVDEFARDLRLLVELVRADGAEVVLFDPARRPQLVTSAPVLALYSAATRSLAAETGATLLDGRAVYGRAVNSGAKYPELFAQRAADPAPLGHERLGAALAELVLPLLEKRARAGGGR